MPAGPSRKERRAIAETKRKEIMGLIWTAMRAALEGKPETHEAFSASLRTADAVITKIIAANPQQKSLILSAAYDVRDQIRRELLRAK